MKVGGERDWFPDTPVYLLPQSSSELINSGLPPRHDEEKQPGSPKC